MQQLEIVYAEARAVGPTTERYAWASDMGTQYMTNAIVRLRTAGGLEGVGSGVAYTDNAYDRSLVETIGNLLPTVIGCNPLDREALWFRLRTLNLPVAPQAQSAIDIALWDLVAKHAGLPLWQLLGGAQRRIRSYASTPLLNDPDAYVAFSSDLIEQGFRAIKFHAWCEADRDLDMARAVARAHGSKGCAFMLDAEQRYDRIDALRAAKELESLGFTWFEAPLLDTDLEGYRDLRRRVDIPILPAGNSLLDLHLIYEGIRSGAWSAVRVDTAVMGGITATRKAMALAEAAGMTLQLQSWGYTLNQAANLHMMLAHRNCSYFEQPVPYPAFEHGMLDAIRTGPDGHVAAPDAPGLGVRVDWNAMEAATIHRCEVGK
jgi:L-alanine-DL-glutamate epimerase-like enolase superfamily enzyme